MEDYITTYTKKRFIPTAPEEAFVDIEDIAHALSQMTRANGHFPEFYSVGQHSIHCCLEAKARGYSERVQFACLLHDGSEAYLADITRPVKQYLDKYREIESRLQTAIYNKYIGPLTEEEQVKIAYVDDAVLYHEFLYYMNVQIEMEEQIINIKPQFFEKPFKIVEYEFLELFKKYQVH